MWLCHSSRDWQNAGLLELSSVDPSYRVFDQRDRLDAFELLNGNWSMVALSEIESYFKESAISLVVV